MHSRFTRAMAFAAATALTLLPASSALAHDSDDFPARTPIRHIVVIFQENVSFDLYFATYPHAAANKNGSVYFRGAKADTPRTNNLVTSGLLANNPNSVQPSPRSCASSKTTLTSAGLATVPATRSRKNWTACSTSTAGRRRAG